MNNRRLNRIAGRWTLRIAFVLLGVACASCRAPSSPEPAGSGPRRIISLVPAATEMLFAIGAGPDVVAVSSFDRHPPEVTRLPSVGALVDPDFERILTLRPTLVVLYGSQDELVSRLERASIPYFRYVHAVEDGLGSITALMRELGARVDRVAAAEAAASDVETALADVRARASTLSRPSTALVFGREPGSLRGLFVSGGVGFLHDVLLAAGGTNTFGDVPRENLQASVEMFLERRPEIILELRSSPQGTDAEQMADRAAWNSLGSIPAVRNNRIYLLTESSISIPGPRIAATALRFFELIHAPTPR